MNLESSLVVAGRVCAPLLPETQHMRDPKTPNPMSEILRRHAVIRPAQLQDYLRLNPYCAGPTVRPTGLNSEVDPRPHTLPPDS